MTPATKPTNLEVTKMPFDLGGFIYRGKMPHKLQLKYLDEYKDLHKISHIFLLQSEEEWNESLGQDLKELYKQHGYTVEHYPIKDGKVISKSSMKELVGKIAVVASEGKNALVHCKGGTGRTSTVLTCLAMDALGYDPVKAKEVVNSAIPSSKINRTRAQDEFIGTYNIDTENSTGGTKAPIFEVTSIPIELGGKVFRGKMPEMAQLEHLDAYKKDYGISHIVMLLTEEEWNQKLQMDLKKIYEEYGYTVLHFPIKDGGIVTRSSMKEITNKIMAITSEGNNVLVHCKGGTGRTSMVLACLGMDALQLNSVTALDIVNNAIPGAKYARVTSQNSFIELYHSSEPLSIEKTGDSLLSPSKPEPEVTHIPFDLGGKVFRGKMPKKHQLEKVEEWKTVHKISHIFLLQPDDEIKSHHEVDLKELYKEKGFTVEHYPIIDGYTIPMERMKELVGKIKDAASHGNNVLIHCMGGKGRTAMVMACLAVDTLGIDGKAAMNFIKAFIPSSEFTKNTFQKSFLLKYE